MSAIIFAILWCAAGALGFGLVVRASGKLTLADVLIAPVIIIVFGAVSLVLYLLLFCGDDIVLARWKK